MVTGGGNSGNRKYNPWTIDEIEQVKETISEKGFFETTAYVRHIKSEGIIMYPGCVTETCSKKANDFGGKKNFIFK